MVTEWGSIGYWEMEKTDWGAPVELTSSEKADVFMRAYQEILSPMEGQLIGSYAFLWGQKQERTPTWFGLFTEKGEATEAVDVMHYNWNDAWPIDRSPRVLSMTLDDKNARENVELQLGRSYTARLQVGDEQMDTLNFRWEVRHESPAQQEGGDFEEALPLLDEFLMHTTGPDVTVTAAEEGEYRLFAYAADQHGNAAHANIPFRVSSSFVQDRSDRIANEVMAVAYSGFRAGQHPDRGQGEINPTDAQVLEDLELLIAHGFGLIRLYDSGSNSRSVLELIRQHDLPLKVLLGMWLKAEVSNHEGCPWLEEEIPAAELAANTQSNASEIQGGIALAKEFESIVTAVNVANEALVEWNDHMVPLERVIAYVRQVKQAISQPVTVAENYDWWARSGASLAAEVDFLGVHSYPAWEDKTIEEALGYTISNIERVHTALPDKPIAILEAGWATVASEFTDRASEANQARYFSEIEQWASAVNATVFFFEAFDESWKGDPNNPMGAEKHWGIFNEDRTPKQVLREIRTTR
jgi:exo-beta-1,3-glucanase (GH17 family)